MTGLTDRDRKRLKGVHPDLVRVVQSAADRTPLTVIEGLRTAERQKQMVAQGSSQTYSSRHITGHAVDLAPLVDGAPSWDWGYFHIMAPIVLETATILRIPVRWGGNWRTLRDGPHFELDREAYP